MNTPHTDLIAPDLSATRNLSSDHAAKSRFVGLPYKWILRGFHMSG
jgi:hypothetical protein